MEAFDELVETFDTWIVAKDALGCEVTIALPCADCGMPLDDECFFGEDVESAIERAVSTVLSEEQHCMYCKEQYSLPYTQNLYADDDGE